MEFTRVFEEYLMAHFDLVDLDEAQPEQIDAFLEWGKGEFRSMNFHLWAISRYYDYTGNDRMRCYANQIRSQKIEKRRSNRQSLMLGEIEGVKSEHIDALDIVGITNVEQLLSAGDTHNSCCRGQVPGAPGINTAHRLRFLAGEGVLSDPPPLEQNVREAKELGEHLWQES